MGRSILYPLIAVCLILSGCSGRNTVMIPEEWQTGELERTPFFPQEKFQCGPASLAMVLGASEINVHPEKLVPMIYLPERRGSLQMELVSAARRYGRIPYQISPDLFSLIREIKAGRPVLVLQNLGAQIWPVYHYAVVIGTLPDHKIVLRSGTNARVEMAASDFQSTWQRAGSWGIVVLKPGEISSDPDPERFIQAVSAYEAIGNAGSAAETYQAAFNLWPGNQTVLFAFANNCLKQRKMLQALSLYRELLEIAPNHVAAANNLAETLVILGYYREADRVISAAVKKAEDTQSPLLPVVKQTRNEILKVVRNEPLKRDTLSPNPHCR